VLRVPRTVLCLALALALVVAAARAPAANRDVRALDVGPHERLLVVAPHPDDETIGAGGLVQRVLARDGGVRVVLVTAGDGYVEAVIHATGLPRPRPAQYIAYGERRLAEARAAMRVLGGDRIRMQVLGFPDGGLEHLLHAYWRRSHPELSATTAAREPPYPEALGHDVAYDGADLRRELLHILREAQPTIVVFPDPVDRHPDHRATGLFTLLALETWTREGGPMPRLLAYLVHWPDWPPGWDQAPSRDAEKESLELPASLPARGQERAELTLDDAEMRTKRLALERYASQQEEMASVLAAFVRRNESFTVFAPDEVVHVDRMIERHLIPHAEHEATAPPPAGGVPAER
jgi:LmbE family N-acetylglucosaminyl deacetylase